MRIIYFILFLSLSSCASKMAEVSPKIVIKNNSLNQSYIKEIGESILIKQYIQEYKALKITSLPEKVLTGNTYPYKVGDVLPLVAEDKQYYLYFPKSDVKEYTSFNQFGKVSTFKFYGIAVSKKDTTDIAPFVCDKSGQLGGVVVIHRRNFSTEPTLFYGDNCIECFKKEIIFNGRVGNNLKFIYREYIENLARPAFMQELQYDLSESSIIGFKGARIEIVEANNTNIKYKVLKDFEN